jgi:tetratricopeptide (TPR) repeat protein
MKPSRSVTIAASLLLLGSMAGSILLLRRVDQVRSGATLQEVLFVSSPKAVKRLSLGYTGLMANIYWTRTVQYFGNKLHAGNPHYELLGPLLEITTALDPQLLVAYRYGVNFLAPKGLAAGDPQKAIELVQFGIRHNPNEWRLHYDLGFVYYIELKDYRSAAREFELGSRLPGAPPTLKIVAANTAQRGGDYQMARVLWATTYETTAEKGIRANAAAHLRAIKVDEDIEALEGIIATYQRKKGQMPEDFSDLIAAGLIRGAPLDPLGHRYKLMADGRIEVADPDHLPFIKKGLPPNYVPPRVPKLLPAD